MPASSTTSPGPTWSARATRHLIWKEWRQLRPLLLGHVALYAFLVLVFAAPNGFERAKYDDVFILAGCFASISVAICTGLVTFTRERALETHRWLGTLPMSDRNITLTKALTSLLVVVVFVFCVGAISEAATGRGPLLVPLLKSALLFFLCSTMVSLHIRRIIEFIPGIFGVLTVGLLGLVNVGKVMAAATGSWRYFGPDVAYFCTIFVSAAVIVWSSKNWISKAPTDRPWTGLFARRSSKNNAARALLWQSFRQSKGTLVTTAILTLVWISEFLLHAGMNADHLEDIQVVVSLISYGSLALFSSIVFSGDHVRGNYRFFHSHVERGRTLWFMRMAPTAPAALLSWGLLALGAAAAATTMFDGRTPESYGLLETVRSMDGWDFRAHQLYFYLLISSTLSTLPTGELPHAAARYSDWIDLVFVAGPQLHQTFHLVFLATPLAIGQFFSMFARSVVYVFIGAMTVSFMAFHWLFLVVSSEAHIGFAAIVPCALFGVSLYKAPAWLAGDRGLKLWGAPALVLIAVFTVTVGASGVPW